MDYLINKVKAPSTPVEFIEISDLFNLLDLGLSKKITFLLSGIGSGKTISLAKWAANNSITLSWVFIDSFDNSMIKLINYIIFSIRKNMNCDFLDDHDFESYVDEKDYLKLIGILIKEFEYRKKTEFYISLDNFENIENNELLKYLSYLINNSPDNVHFYILSRKKNISLISSNNYSNFILIDQKYFIFNLEHINNYYLMKSIRLSQKDLIEVLNLSEGWVLGLDICHKFLSNNNKIKTYHGKNNESYSLIFINEIILLPDNIKIFLFNLSILPVFNDSLSNFINKIDYGKEIIEDLYEYHFIKIVSEGFYTMNRLISKIISTQFFQFDLKKRDDIIKDSINWYIKENMYKQALDQCIVLKEYSKVIYFLELIYKNNKNIEVTKYLKDLEIKDIIGSESILNLYVRELIFENKIISAEKIINKVIEEGCYKYFEVYKAQIELIKNSQIYCIEKYNNSISILNKYITHKNEDIVVKACNVLCNAYIDNSEIYKSFNLIKDVLPKIKNNENIIKINLDYIVHLKIYLQISKAFEIIKQSMDKISEDNLERPMIDCLVKILCDEIDLHLIIGKNDHDFYSNKMTYIKSLSKNDFYSNLYWLFLCIKFNIINNNFYEAEKIILSLELAENNIRLSILSYNKHLLLIFKEDYENLRKITSETFLLIKNGKCFNPSLINIVVISLIQLEEYEQIKELIKIFNSNNLEKDTLIYLEHIVIKSIFEYKTDNKKYLELIIEAIEICSKKQIFGCFIYLPRKILVIVQLIINNVCKISVKKIDKFKKYEFDFINDLRKLLSKKIENNNYSNNSFLTVREKEIIIMMSKGLSNKEIANTLFISLNTVKVHLSRVYKKMNVKKRKDAIMFANYEGIL